jgi:hypothetical protein
VGLVAHQRNIANVKEWCKYHPSESVMTGLQKAVVGADSEEKHEPATDIDIAAVSSLKVLDPKWPIREADVVGPSQHVRLVPPGRDIAPIAAYGSG